MELFLIRHAKSDWKHKNLSDHQRPLNNRGRGDVSDMASLFNKNMPDRFLYSDAIRAEQTAKGLAEAINLDTTRMTSHHSLYLAQPSEILDCLRENASGKTSWLCAHNPGISEAATQFCEDAMDGNSIGDLPTLGVVHLEFPKSIETWADINWAQAKLKNIYRPGHGTIY